VPGGLRLRQVKGPGRFHLFVKIARLRNRPRSHQRQSYDGPHQGESTKYCHFPLSSFLSVKCISRAWNGTSVGATGFNKVSEAAYTSLDLGF
jgi:hypothetical protein